MPTIRFPFHASHLLAAALLTAGTMTAHAQPAAPAAPTAPTAAAAPAHPHGDPAQRQARMAARLSELKAKLAITPQQETAWTAFTAALQPGPRPARPDRAELQALPTPQRIDRMRALRSEHMARQDRRADAVKTFYAALDANQQKTFDAQPMPGLHGGHPRHGGGNHPHGMKG